MFQRAVVSLSTHVVPRQDIGLNDFEPVDGSDFRIIPPPNAQDILKRRTICTGIFGSLEDINVTIFPDISRFCSHIGHMIGLHSESHPCTQWPPQNDDIDRETWIITTSYPILPEGRESELALARVRFPIAHIRIPVMGPEYIKALSILSDSKQLTEEPNLEDQWYLPDVQEFVDFTLDTTRSYTNP
jgi:hypothetical protein